MPIKQRIIQCFNQSASTYDGAADVQKEAACQLAQRISALSPNNILEIGCGTGLLSQHITSLFPQSICYLTDIAPAMVLACSKKFAAQPHIQAACMDGEAINLLPSFDLIASSMTLHWFSDLQKSLVALSAKLSEKGALVFSMLGNQSLKEWRELCKQHSIAYATPLIYSTEQIKQMLPGLIIQVEVRNIIYSTLYDFLKHLKLLGAHASDAAHTPASATQLRQLLKLVTGPFQVSYEIIYGTFSK